MADIVLTNGDEVSFIDKFLGDDSIYLLCEKLKRTPKEKLKLRGDQITSSGAKSIADLLRVQNHLQSISLEWNQLGSSGAIFLAEALKTNLSVTLLDLRNNNINSDGAVALADSMSNNSTLLVLDLRWNQIDDRGALCFKSAILERKPTLNVLLAGNAISESTMATVNGWLEQARVVKEIPPPPPVIAPPEPAQNNAQLEFLQREVIALRSQVTVLHNDNADVRRQLDTSSMRITELEQLLIREQYQTSQLSESLKQALLRNSFLVDERTTLTNSWDRERAELMAEMVQLAKDKEISLKERTIERDNMQNSYDKLADENSQMRLQFEHLQEQLATDREVNINELRNAVSRLNESLLAETKLKADLAASKVTQQRLQDRIHLLEQELEIHRQEHRKQVAEERERCDLEISRLKDEHAALMNALLERNVVQAKEITTLQALISTLRHEISTQKKELQEAYEASLREVKEAERRRAEELMADLRQRVEVLTVARAELEARCASYMQELRDQTAAHELLVQQLQQQLALSQEELARLRQANSNLRTLQVTLETTNADLQIEVNALRSRLSALETNSKSWQSELQQAQLAKQKLAERLQRLEMKHQALKDAREREFQLVSESAMNAVRDQFDALRVTLRIGMDPDDHSVSPHPSPSKPSFQSH